MIAGRRRDDLPTEAIARAVRLREGGYSWAEVGSAVGVHKDTIRRRLDPDFGEHANKLAYAAKARRVGYGPVNHVVERRMSDAEAQRVIASVPQDTRGRTARMMGDPLPGRSALDQKENPQVIPTTSWISQVQGTESARPSGFFTQIGMQ